MYREREAHQEDGENKTCTDMVGEYSNPFDIHVRFQTGIIFPAIGSPL